METTFVDGRKKTRLAPTAVSPHVRNVPIRDCTKGWYPLNMANSYSQLFLMHFDLSLIRLFMNTMILYCFPGHSYDKQTNNYNIEQWYKNTRHDDTNTSDG